MWRWAGMAQLIVRSRADSKSLQRDAIAIEELAWSGLGFLSHTKAHQKYYDDILEEYADLQLCLVDVETDYPVAAINCVPVPNVPTQDLPPEGWDWLVEVGATSQKRDRTLLGALAVSVPPENRGRGYARAMIRALAEEATKRGFERVVTPVRPSAKHRYAEVMMSEYIKWEDEKGRAFDPWLRSHLAVGGRVVHLCERSMVVDEHISFWETWAGREFDKSGQYIVEGALSPISIDLEQQTGRYEEPNVWVTYSA